MSGSVRTIPAPGEAGAVSVGVPLDAAGRVPLTIDRQGSGWYALRVSIDGQRGGDLAWLSLTPSMARDLAAKLTRAATFIDARTGFGTPTVARLPFAPCLCTAWSHNLYPCPRPAADDYSMCRECWTPELGQSALTMGHGEEDRR